MEVHIIE